ncbi:MAG: type II toxin-antitoxin system HicB family antitoxin [Chloroflexota bacterium]|nr:type II toxin-antitoxin system HicB family antitoxin [Chloroflexota bacterium]
MHKYGIAISWCAEDGVFIAEAPGLPGCMAHGDTQQEALVEIDQAIDLWIETALEFRDPVPEPMGYVPAVD